MRSPALRFTVCGAALISVIGSVLALATSPAGAADVEAAFVFSEDRVAGEAISFFDTSTGPIAWAYWNFGDGSRSHDRNPTHIFAEPGDYTVAFSVCASKTSCDRTTRSVSISAAAAAEPDQPSSETTQTEPDPTDDDRAAAAFDVEIAYAPAPPAAGDTVLFISRVTTTDGSDPSDPGWSYNWDLDANQSSTSTEYINYGSGLRFSQERFPVSSFPEGTHTVSLLVCAPSTESSTGECERTETSVKVGPRRAADMPAVQKTRLEVGDARVGQPLEAVVSSNEVEVLGTFFWLGGYDVRGRGRFPYWKGGPGPFSEPGNADTFVTTPLRPGWTNVAAAACYLDPDLTCDLLIEGFTVVPAGSPSQPEAPGDLAVHRLPPEWAGYRVGWIDANEGETGYRVRSGPGPEQLTIVDDFPANTQAIRLTPDEAERARCVEVRALFNTTEGPTTEGPTTNGPTTEGPPSTTCERSEQAPPTGGATIPWLTYPAQPRAGEAVALVRLNPSTGLYLKMGVTTFTEPGVYDVRGEEELSNFLADNDRPPPITVIDADAPRPDINLEAPADLENLSVSEYTWTDTNSSDDGHVMVEIPLFHSIEGTYCREVRAFRDGRLGPPSGQACGNRYDGRVEQASLKAVARDQPGVIDVTVRSRAGFRAEAVRPDEYDHPMCDAVSGASFMRFDYELAPEEGDLPLRAFSVTLDGLTSGVAYAINARTVGTWNNPLYRICNGLESYTDLVERSGTIIAP